MGSTQHLGGELDSLDDYRNRYALYRTDENLEAVHAAFPRRDSRRLHRKHSRRRANAYQANYEHMPLPTSFSGRNEFLHHGQVAGDDVARQEMMGFFHERDIPDPIVLSGDIHTNFVNELKVDFDDIDSAMEFVGTSMSSRQRDAKTEFDRRHDGRESLQ